MGKYIIKMRDGGSISPEKAKQILSDGKIRGTKLSEKQRKFFGAMSNKAENGATIEQISGNAYSSPMIQFNGPSHENGGMDIVYAGQPVEVEGQETGFVDKEGALVVLGNLNVPGTKTKFKTVGKEIAKAEVKTLSQLDKGMKLINEADPYDTFERLKFNSGNAMAKGAQLKQQELSAVKEGISALQNDILEQANTLGVDPKQLQKGKAKYGIKIAQEGGTYPWLDGLTPVSPYVSPEGDPVTSNKNGKLSLAQRHNNPGNMMYNPKSGPQQRNGAAPGEPRYQNGKLIGHYAKFPSVEAGQRAMQQLLTGPSYKNLTVAQASNRWTGEGAYKNIPEGLRNKKINELNPQELIQTLDTFTKGEDSKVYNWNLPEMPQTGVTLPEVEITANRPPTPRLDLEPVRGVQNRPLNTNISTDLINPVPNSVTPLPPSTTTTSQSTRAPFRNPLRFGQIAPEIFTIATERAGFVPGQRFDPNLYQPYQVSFQDRLNENQATFNAIGRQLGGSRNSSAVASLAAQKYQADSAVLAEEFRTNQGITNDITNKNIALLNQAQLTNLQLNDQQFVRQEQARANTRQNIRNAVQSISDKVQQNRLETATYNTYSNLFPQYTFDQTNQVQFVPNEGLQIGAQIASGNAVRPLTTQATTRR